MISHSKKLICLMIMIFTLAGCSTKAVIGNGGGSLDPTGSSMGIFSTEPSDKDLFEAALSHFSNSEKEPNYQEAKPVLDKLVAQFPKSRWTPAAQALLSGIDRITALQIQLKQEQQKTRDAQAKLQKELDVEKGRVEEKYSAEMTRLQQENEQLKKDIQQLKTLELQLEKREKMLR